MQTGHRPRRRVKFCNTFCAEVSDAREATPLTRRGQRPLAQTPRRLCSPRPRTLITPRRDSAAACAGPRRPCAKTQFSVSGTLLPPC